MLKTIRELFVGLFIIIAMFAAPIGCIKYLCHEFNVVEHEFIFIVVGLIIYNVFFHDIFMRKYFNNEKPWLLKGIEKDEE
jgi:hypothetical protein